MRDELPQRRSQRGTISSFDGRGKKWVSFSMLIVQTIVWYGFMAAIIFAAAGTMQYTGGWLYLGVMIATSIVFGTHMVRVDPGLLRERLKPPVQKDQPLADKLVRHPDLAPHTSEGWASWRRTLRGGAGR